MRYFVDLDVSQKSTIICIVDTSGSRIWRGQCVTYFRKTGPVDLGAEQASASRYAVTSVMIATR